MKKIILLLFAFVITGKTYCQQSSQNPKMDAFIGSLMSKMTLEEKIGQLNLSTGGGGIAGGPSAMDSLLAKGMVGATGGFTIQAIRHSQEAALKSRLKIPLLFGMDVIHGYKTVFPIPLGLSCIWNPELIEKSARIAATEASANGISWTYSPMVDIARDPRWGRIAEGSGEDPYLASQIASAMVKGYQGDDLSKNNTILACVKHFGLYGAAEAGRDYNTVDMSRLTMLQFYLPPYKAAFDVGAGSAMSSFNVIDYVPATGNKWLLTDLLRSQWGFKGFVVSDYNSIGEMNQHGLGDIPSVSAKALKAGLDMDMATNGYITHLKKLLQEGKVTQKDIDLACRRVLEAKYKLGLFEDPYRYINEERIKTDVLTPESMETARDISRKSIVLLKNNNQLLPLKKAGTIAVIGPLANSKIDMLGTWAFMGDVNKVITAVEGIGNALSNKGRVIYAKGSSFTDDPYLLKNSAGFGFGPRAQADTTSNLVLLKSALDSAGKADVIIAVLGEQATWSGEAASRADIGLPECQRNLLKSLLSTNKPVVLVLMSGRPLTIPWENANVPAIIEAWHGGTQAGNAVADVLFGDYNPSGKLTSTFPQSVGQIPLYYNHLNTGRPMNPKDKFTSKYLDISNDPLYPFGFGLSYTKFEYSDISVNKSQLKGTDVLTVNVTITNSGKFSGEETVQLYINDPVASISRPVKELKGFKKVFLQPGEKKEISFNVSPEDLKFYNSDLKYDWESGDFNIFIGTNSSDLKLIKVNWLK